MRSGLAKCQRTTRLKKELNMGIGPGMFNDLWKFLTVIGAIIFVIAIAIGVGVGMLISR